MRCNLPRRVRSGVLGSSAVVCGSILLAYRSVAFLPPPSIGAALRPPQFSAVQAEPWQQIPVVAATMFGSLGVPGAKASIFDSGIEMTPENFRPVCPASDNLYRFGKVFIDSALGADGQEYRPLAIEALLRVRLEICVLESFVYEAILPFVERRGLGWILPFHETIDTVIAGTVFAVAVNFILFGTTKILAVLAIYHDFLIGAPLRLIGYAILPEARPKDVPLFQINWPGAPVQGAEQVEPIVEGPPPPLPLMVVGKTFKTYGVVAEVIKNILEGFDTFVGRYLVVVSVTYIAFKWAHFRIFPDFPPFGY